jgi:PAS domain S-box-containing protein
MEQIPTSLRDRLVEDVEDRRELWHHILRLLKTVHRHRLPGRRFGPDLELLVIYGAAFSKGRSVRSSDIARSLEIPRETVRRQLCRLAGLGLLERDGHKFRLSAVTDKMSGDVMDRLSAQPESTSKIDRPGSTPWGHLMGVDPATSPAILWTGRPNGTIWYLNPAWTAATGISQEEGTRAWNRLANLQDRKLWDLLIHPDDRNDYISTWLRAVETKRPHWFHEGRLRGRDGEYHWFRSEAVPLFDGGKLVKWTGTKTLIERKNVAVA